MYRSSLAAVPDNLSLSRSYGQLLLKQGRRPTRACSALLADFPLPDVGNVQLWAAEVDRGSGNGPKSGCSELAADIGAQCSELEPKPSLRRVFVSAKLLR